MRIRLSHLSILCLPALALVAALVAWSAGAQADGCMHHQDDVHAMHTAGGNTPCVEETAKAAPGDHHDSGDHGCPDCLCPVTGCASATLPGMTGMVPRTFAPAPLRAVPAVRLETQALVGPPAEPPRL